MPKQPGRDQRAPMERLVRLAMLLHDAGARGVPRANLLAAAGWADSADGASQLARDFRHLSRLGWQIDNVAEQGHDAIYRMRTVDNRLRLRLSAEEQAALRRAAIVANRHDLNDRLGLAGGSVPEVGATVRAAVQATPPDGLAILIDAVESRRLLRFGYKGTPRVVHPAMLRMMRTQWYLRGQETGDGVIKMFVVSRMTDVTADAPGTADPVDDPERPSLHPMHWQIDPPVQVTLRSPDEYAADTRRWLGRPITESSTDGVTMLVYRVTHRAALRSRLYLLGTRVEVVGPDEIRAEILDELSAMAGE